MLTIRAAGFAEKRARKREGRGDGRATRGARVSWTRSYQFHFHKVARTVRVKVSDLKA